MAVHSVASAPMSRTALEANCCGQKQKVAREPSKTDTLAQRSSRSAVIFVLLPFALAGESDRVTKVETPILPR